MSRHRATLLAATMLAGLAAAMPANAGSAGDSMVNAPIPPMPSAGAIDTGQRTLGRGINTPITGASISGRMTGGERPPSLEALQALRPDELPAEGAEGMRARAVCDEGKAYGTRGGMGARAFGINEMLRRHEVEMDARFDFSGLMVQATNRTVLAPPVVTEAQLAFALGDGGQTARETGRIYQITRRARLLSKDSPPHWTTYLVRQWDAPTAPPDILRPRTDKEAAMWTRCVASGWAEGERLAVEQFRSDLAQLEGDLIGMARYHVLLQAGLVEPPRVALRHIKVQGGGTDMRTDDTTISITGQRGLNPNQQRWRATPQVAPDGPIGRIGR